MLASVPFLCALALAFVDGGFTIPVQGPSSHNDLSSTGPTALPIDTTFDITSKRLPPSTQLQTRENDKRVIRGQRFQTTINFTLINGTIGNRYEVEDAMAPLTFIRRQAQLLETQMHPDGSLKTDSWVNTNNGIGLYARPVPGQKLTYGILSSAIKGLLSILDLRVEGSTTHYPLLGGTFPSTLTDSESNNPMAPLSYTFNIYEGKYGNIAQAVVCACPEDDLACFVPYGYPA